MDDELDDKETTSRPTARRPRRPTAQRSVHELVLNLTQNPIQSQRNLSQNMNKKTKTCVVSTTPTTTATTTMTTTATTAEAPPDCKWTVGQRVEARDVVGDWYSAKIVSFSEDRRQLLVHFERWSSRYDQWFDLDSDLIREKSDANDGNGVNDDSARFEVHEEVLARWTDNRPYPATIVERFDAQKTVLVLFYDGYRKRVKTSQIEKMPQNYSGLRIPQTMNKEFRVKDDHNDYKCHFHDCNKGFRKQSLLAQHLKHYHKSDDKPKIETTSATTPTPVVATPPPITPKPAAVKPVPPSVVSSDVPTPPPTTTTTSSKSRLKRKYVRKSMPSTAVRKSNRIEQNETTVCSLPTTPVVASIVPTTSVVKETPIVVNTTLPFWDARTVAEIHENDDIEELVHCVCDAREESGLMVQCELCLTWQHAHCMHFDGESEVPSEGYFCFSCRFPKYIRFSRRNCFLINHWLKTCKKPKFEFSSRETDKQRHLLSATHALLSAALDAKDVLRTLDAPRQDERRDHVRHLLESVSSKVSLLEKECDDEEDDGNDTRDDAELKNQLFLAFEDLERAKNVVSNERQ